MDLHFENFEMIDARTKMRAVWMIENSTLLAASAAGSSRGEHMVQARSSELTKRVPFIIPSTTALGYLASSALYIADMARIY